MFFENGRSSEGMGKSWHHTNLQEWKQEEPINYRPLLTSVLFKICKKVVKNSQVNIQTNEILRTRQFGFQEGKSYVTNFLNFCPRVLDNTGGRWMVGLHILRPQKGI